MNYKHHWINQEANFGSPQHYEVSGGAHVSFEVLPRFRDTYVLGRRPRGVPGHILPPSAQEYPQGLLYLCYDLIRWGESTEVCISRILTTQLHVSMHSFRAVHFYSFVHEAQNNWALTPCFIAELKELPSLSSEVTEIVCFKSDSIPSDIAWWSPDQLKELIGTYAL